MTTSRLARTFARTLLPRSWAGRVALLLVVACVSSACRQQGNPAGASAGATLVASGHPEWPPIMYRNGNTIDGAGPALVKKILDAVGVPASVTFPYQGTWDEVQAKARAGTVDILVAAYKTTEREGYMVYSDPYTTDPVAVFVAKGRAFPFAVFADLIGKRGIAMVGDSYGQAFDDFAAAQLSLQRVATIEEAF